MSTPGDLLRVWRIRALLFIPMHQIRLLPHRAQSTTTPMTMVVRTRVVLTRSRTVLVGLIGLCLLQQTVRFITVSRHGYVKQEAQTNETLLPKGRSTTTVLPFSDSTLPPVFSLFQGVKPPYNKSTRQSPRPMLLPLTELTNSPEQNKYNHTECPPSLILTDDTVLDASTAFENGRQIPKIIHFSFPSRCLPRVLARSVRRWTKAFPDHSVFLHDRDAMQRLFHQEWPEFPHLHKVVACIQHDWYWMTMLWQWMVLYRYGGIHIAIYSRPGPAFHTTDGNNNNNNNFTTLLDSPTTAVFAMNIWTEPVTEIFALQPQHPSAYMGINEMLNRIVTANLEQTFTMDYILGSNVVKSVYLDFSQRFNTTSTTTTTTATTTFTAAVSPDNTTLQTVPCDWIIQKPSGLTVDDKLVPSGRGQNKRDKDLFEENVVVWQNRTIVQPPYHCSDQMYITDGRQIHFEPPRVVSETTTATATAPSGAGDSTTTLSETEATATFPLPSLVELAGSNVTNVNCPPPLIPVYDKIVNADEAYDPTIRKVPRVLHLSHKSRCLPAELANAVESWKRALPDHSIFFHDDAAVERLFALDWPEFPQLTKMRQCIQYSGAMLIDVWRLLVVYRYGGIYTDIDNLPGPLMNETAIPNDAEALFLSTIRDKPTQWFFATEPRHPILYHAIWTVMTRIAGMTEMEQPRVVMVTGPYTVLHAYFHFLGMTDIQTNRTLRGTQNKTVYRLSYSFTDGYVLSGLNGTMEERSRWGANTTKTRRQRMDEEMGVLHWKKALDTGKHKGLTGYCSDFLREQDMSRENRQERMW